MNSWHAIFAASLLTLLTMSGCGTDNDRPQEASDDDVSVDEQMSPASENRPAGIGREDTTATPGTRPTTTDQPEDQEDVRDRLPPDG